MLGDVVRARTRPARCRARELALRDVVRAR